MNKVSFLEWENVEDKACVIYRVRDIAENHDALILWHESVRQRDNDGFALHDCYAAGSDEWIAQLLPKGTGMPLRFTSGTQRIVSMIESGIIQFGR